MKTASKLNRATWNTFGISGYAHQVGTDGRATGGVHRHEVRRTRAGHWQKRVVDSNGRFESSGPVTPISAEDGEAFFATAEAR